MIRKLLDSIFETMSGTRKGIEDVLVSMLPQAVTVVTGFLTSVFIARGLGPKGMGSYALILSISGLASALSDLGIGQTAIRFASQAVAQNDTPRQLSFLRWAFRIRMVLVFLVSVVIFICSPLIAERFWKDPDLTFLLRASLLIGIFTAISAIPTIYFQSLKRFKMNSAVSVGQTLISFIGIVLLALYSRWSLEGIFAVSIIAGGVGAFVFIALVPKESFYSGADIRKAKGSLLARLFKSPPQNIESENAMDTTGANTFAFYMIISSLTVTVIMRADIWLMGYFLGKSQIGLYSVATRFTLPLVIVLGALNTALWPRASALTSLSNTKEMITKTFKLSLMVACAGMIYAIFAPLVTPYIFGPIYAGGVFLGQLLCLRYCFAILTCPVGVIGYSIGLVRVYWLINFLQLVVVVTVNVLLLPRVGAVGSAIALIANELVGFIIITVIIWRKMATLKGGYERKDNKISTR